VGWSPSLRVCATFCGGVLATLSTVTWQLGKLGVFILRKLGAGLVWEGEYVQHIGNRQSGTSLRSQECSPDLGKAFVHKHALLYTMCNDCKKKTHKSIFCPIWGSFVLVLLTLDRVNIIKIRATQGRQKTYKEGDECRNCIIMIRQSATGLLTSAKRPVKPCKDLVWDWHTNEISVPTFTMEDILYHDTRTRILSFLLLSASIWLSLLAPSRWNYSSLSHLIISLAFYTASSNL